MKVKIWKTQPQLDFAKNLTSNQPVVLSWNPMVLWGFWNTWSSWFFDSDFFHIPRTGQFFDSVFLSRHPEQAVLWKIKEPPSTGNYSPPSICVLVTVGSLWVFICWKTRQKRCNAGRRGQTMSMDIGHAKCCPQPSYLLCWALKLSHWIQLLEVLPE